MLCGGSFYLSIFSRNPAISASSSATRFSLTLALYQAKESGRDRVVAAAAFEGGEPQWSGLLRSSERDAGAAPSSASTLRDKPHAA